MPKTPFTFNLSPQGKLRWAIASLLLATSLPQALAGGVVVAPGPGGTAQLQTQGGVPIVNIVAPNGAGLSHNQFLDYNVDRQGLVLNNALQAGHSQLAGELAANPQFQGQAASVILNEVVSRNASAINGAQEIFGRAADYVLANPNGISVNGASFINAPNASLVVGRPELEAGRLKALGTQDANGRLQVQGAGLRNDGGSVNLIAPRIDSQGRLDARDQLNLTVGRNQVDYTSGQVKVLDGGAASGEQRIDASLFGAMQAGRINIVSTAQGAGVRVGPEQIEGRDGVRIDSAGDLNISGAAVADSLQATRAGVRSSQGNVQLRGAQDLTLAAADVAGRDVKLDAGRNLTLSTVQSRKLQEKRENWRSGALGIDWETYQRTQTDSDTREHGVQVVAQRDVRANAGQDLTVNATSIEAPGQLSLNSGGDLRLTAATERQVNSDQGKHTKGFWKADWDNRSETQRSVTSQLKGGDIELRAKASVLAEGAQLTSGQDIRIAGKQVQISNASRTDQRDSQNQQSKFFGVSHNEAKQNSRESTAVRSELVAGGSVGLNSAESIEVVGSTVKATGALNADAAGDLKVASAQDTREHGSASSSRGFVASAKETASGSGQYRAGVGYASDRQSATGSQVSQQGSSLSGSEVQLTAGADLTVKGAAVKSTAGDTTLTGKQVSLLAEQDSRSESRDSSHTGGGVYLTAGLDRAGAGVEFAHGTQQDTSNSSTAKTTGIDSAGSLTIKADTLASEGAQVNSAGTLSVSANQVDNRAARDTTSSSHQQSNWTADVGVNVEYKDIARPIAGVVKDVVGGKVSVKDALDGKLPLGDVKDVLAGNTTLTDALGKLGTPNLGVDLAVGHASQQQGEQAGTAVVSQFNGQGVQLDVAGALKDQGTQYNANGGALNIKAGALQADAASNTHSRSEQQVNADVSARVYTKTGEDLNVTASGSGGSKSLAEDRSTAVVGTFTGNQGLNIQVGGDARFEGSRLDGGQGAVAVNTGGKLALQQASNHERRDTSSLAGSASLTVGTLPVGDKVDLGAGLQLDHAGAHSADSKAQVASISGSGPVRLGSGGDQTLQGTRIDAAGPAELKTGGALDLQAASDTRTVSGSHLGGGLNLGGKAATGEQGRDLSGKLGGNFNVGQTNERSQTLSGGQLNSHANVDLAGQSVHLQGTQVAARGVNVGAGEGGLALESAQSTQSRNNWGVELKAGGNLSRNTPVDAGQQATASHDFDLGGKVHVDHLQGTTQQNSRIAADTVALNSTGAAQLSGARVEGQHIGGKLDGGLSIQERQDTTTSVRLDLGAGLVGKPGEAKEGEAKPAFGYTPSFNAQGEFVRKAGVQETSQITAQRELGLQVKGVEQGGNTVGAEVKPLGYQVKATLDLPKLPEAGLPSVSLDDGKLKVGPVTVEGQLDGLTNKG
ncbi:hemagglutinin repeat-containing protein [Pseudomonas soli]|uniref:Hemagglutinin repeat-containing protein n=1 Tax=Pseudomonas soli TaxID=1306993 RepID=A0ABU7GUK2_9PSED|nr:MULTISPECIES: hemagglutinin repeat-containing protein [Pseudomonas]AUY32787.1 filamentous hemagglutinin [Pseudomonas sp. PONIH3]MEE1882693.1 hemagglutinin repeat-containing protein [Pseudomonas soli]